ncbi:MAG: PA14 domain-containing protein [Polyangiaceae bacterium]|nr:PA14 domain-containing protein [Polyangiaceae bacterium]
MYTNVLNIPERVMTGGFPGVTTRNEWFAIDYVGRFTVKRPGAYSFRLHSDDGSILWIDGQLVIDNDGAHPPQSKTAKVNLDAGSHKLRVLYFQATGGIALQLFTTPPGGKEGLWRAAL